MFKLGQNSTKQLMPSDLYLSIDNEVPIGGILTDEEILAELAPIKSFPQLD